MNVNKFNSTMNEEKYAMERVEIDLNSGYKVSQSENKLTITGVKKILVELGAKPYARSLYSPTVRGLYSPMETREKASILIESNGKLGFKLPKPDYTKMQEKELLEIMNTITNELVSRNKQKTVAFATTSTVTREDMKKTMSDLNDILMTELLKDLKF